MTSTVVEPVLAIAPTKTNPRGVIRRLRTDGFALAGLALAIGLDRLTSSMNIRDSDQQREDKGNVWRP